MKLNSKAISFIVMMIALGSALSAISMGLSRVDERFGIDLAHIATFIAAIYGGPVIGFLTGLGGGIVPGIYLGPLGPLSWLGLIFLPLGKSLTGFTTGALYKFLNVERRNSSSLLTIPIILVGYVPECLFTVFFFLAMVPSFLSFPIAACITQLIVVLVKAWIEISFMSFFMGALKGNVGFNTLVTNYLSIHRAQ